jgi:hypothetical protein
MKVLSPGLPLVSESIPSTWVHLHIDEIERLLRVLELKRWWVSEVIGVHKTTLRRWLQGKIYKVRSYRAAALARVLEVQLCEISIDDKQQQT